MASARRAGFAKVLTVAAMAMSVVGVAQGYDQMHAPAPGPVETSSAAGLSPTASTHAMVASLIVTVAALVASKLL